MAGGEGGHLAATAVGASASVLRYLSLELPAGTMATVAASGVTVLYPEGLNSGGSQLGGEAMP